MRSRDAQQAPLNDELRMAAERGQAGDMERIINPGADVNATDSRDMTPCTWLLSTAMLKYPHNLSNNTRPSISKIT